MIRYDIVRNSNSNELFAVIVHGEQGQSFHGLSAKGEEWALWAQNNISDQQIKTLDPYLQVAKTSYAKDVQSLNSAITRIKQEGIIMKDKVKVASVKTGAQSLTPSFREFQLAIFAPEERGMVVDFKALSFIADSTRSSKALIQRVTGAKTIDALSRKASQPVVQTKAARPRLGARIGGGLRSPGPGMVFVDVTGAIDADADGIVFEGTPMKRPIIPRMQIPRALAARMAPTADRDAARREIASRRSVKPTGARSQTSGVPAGRVHMVLSESELTTVSEVVDRIENDPDFPNKESVSAFRTALDKAIADSDVIDMSQDDAERFLEDINDYMISSARDGSPDTDSSDIAGVLDEALSSPDRLMVSNNLIEEEQTPANRRIQMNAQARYDAEAYLDEMADRQREGSRSRVVGTSDATRKEADAKARDAFRNAILDRGDGDNGPKEIASDVLALRTEQRDLEDKWNALYEKYQETGGNLTDAEESEWGDIEDRISEIDNITRGYSEYVSYATSEDAKRLVEQTSGAMLRNELDSMRSSIANDEDLTADEKSRMLDVLDSVEGDIPSDDSLATEYWDTSGSIDIADRSGLLDALEIDPWDGYESTDPVEIAEGRVAEEMLNVESAIDDARRGSRSRTAFPDVTPEEESQLAEMSLSEIADWIRDDMRRHGKKAPFGAVPYLDAMSSMDSINDNYGADDGRSIVAYALSNLTSYRGPGARAAKAELKRRLDSGSRRGTGSRSRIIDHLSEARANNQRVTSFRMLASSTGDRGSRGMKKEWTAEFVPAYPNAAIGEIRVSWGREGGTLQSKIYKGKDYADFTDLVYGKRERGYSVDTTGTEPILDQEEYLKGARAFRQGLLTRVGKGGKSRIDTTGSSAVTAMSWDDDKKELTVTFPSGKTYTYSNTIPGRGPNDPAPDLPGMVREMEVSESIGRTINDIKRQGYAFTPDGEHAPESTLRGATADNRRGVGMRSSIVPRGQRGIDWDYVDEVAGRYETIDESASERAERLAKEAGWTADGYSSAKQEIAKDFRGSTGYNDALAGWVSNNFPNREPGAFTDDEIEMFEDSDEYADALSELMGDLDASDIASYARRGGSRSRTEKPAQNLAQQILERSDAAFGGYARWDDDTYDYFDSAARILDGEVVGGGRYARAFEDRRDRIASGEYLEELNDRDRKLVAEFFDRAATESRKGGSRSRNLNASGAPRSYVSALNDEIPLLGERFSITSRGPSYPMHPSDPYITWNGDGWEISFNGDNLSILVQGPDPHEVASNVGRIVDAADELFDTDAYRGSDTTPRQRIANFVRDIEELFDDGDGVSLIEPTRLHTYNYPDPSWARRVGSRSRAPKPDFMSDDDVAIDMMLEETDAISDELKSFLSMAENGNEPELENAIKEILDALELANDANDMVMFSRQAAELVADAITLQVENGEEPAVMLGRVGGLIRDAIDAGDNGEIIISNALDESGTRLTMPSEVPSIRRRKLPFRRGGSRSRTEKPAQNLAQQILERSDAAFGGYARWDDDTYDYFDSAARILDGEVVGGGRYARAFEDRRDRIASGEYLEELNDRDRKLVAEFFDRAATESRKGGSRSRTDQRPNWNVPVTGSSALQQASYDENNRELIITFPNGQTYTYEDVDFDELPDGPLTGRMVNELKKTKPVRKGGTHTFDPTYQNITGPGQTVGRQRLRRSGSGTKTQIPVGNSSAVEAITWDDNKKDLIVTFKGGRTYTYKDVDDYWVDELEDEPNGAGRIINQIKKEGYRVENGGEHGDMPSAGLQAERARFGMRSRSRSFASARSRTDMAVAERGDTRRGMATRRRIDPGVTRVSDQDGRLWAGLSPDDRETIKGRAQAKEKELLQFFKDSYRSYWQQVLDRAQSEKWKKKEGWVDENTPITQMIFELDSLVRKSQKDPSISPTKKAQLLRNMDDLRTLFNMRGEDNYELLEHLTPSTRGHLFDDAKRNDGKTTSINAQTAKRGPSTFRSALGDSRPIAQRAAQAAPADGDAKPEARPTPKMRDRVAGWAEGLRDSVLYESARRRRLRQMREARKNGMNAGGFSADERQPLKPLERRARLAKRAVILKKGAKRDVPELATDATKNRVNGRLLARGENGKITISDNFAVTLGAALDADEKHKRLKKSKKKAPEGGWRNEDMAFLWDGAGYNGTPMPVTKDQFDKLIEAGWTPIIRGHGTSPGSGRYAEDYIDDPVRFIPGQGGEAAGPGDYHSVIPQGKHWLPAYVSQNEPTATAALLPPDTRRVKQSELSVIQKQHRQIADSLRKFDAGLPEGERDKMAAADYAEQAMDFVRSDLGDKADGLMASEMGQIVAQLMNQLSSASPSEKRNILDALTFLNKMAHHRHPNHYAPLLGYDTISVDERELVHNRTALVVLGETVDYDGVKEIDSRVRGLRRR